jgi:hypothetical protein
MTNGFYGSLLNLDNHSSLQSKYYKTPVLQDENIKSTYNSSVNEPVPDINLSNKSDNIEYMNSNNTDKLLKEIVFLLKIIILLLTFLVLSKLLDKN